MCVNRRQPCAKASPLESVRAASSPVVWFTDDEDESYLKKAQEAIAHAYAARAQSGRFVGGEPVCDNQARTRGGTTLLQSIAAS